MTERNKMLRKACPYDDSIESEDEAGSILVSHPPAVEGDQADANDVKFIRRSETESQGNLKPRSELSVRLLQINVTAGEPKRSTRKN